MVSLAGPEPDGMRETAFIVERYHRALEQELAQVQRWLEHRTSTLPELARSVRHLAARLAAHTAFQEVHMFPLLEAGTACPPDTCNSWVADAALLEGALARVERACDANDARDPLVARVKHLTREMHAHVDAETLVLSEWTGLSASSPS